MTLNPANTHSQFWPCSFFYTGYWKGIRSQQSCIKYQTKSWKMQNWKGKLKTTSQCLKPKVFICMVAFFPSLSVHKFFMGSERSQKESLFQKLDKVWNIRELTLTQTRLGEFLKTCPAPHTNTDLIHNYSQRSKRMSERCLFSRWKWKLNFFKKLIFFFYLL